MIQSQGILNLEASTMRRPLWSQSVILLLRRKLRVPHSRNHHNPLSLLSTSLCGLSQRHPRLQRLNHQVAAVEQYLHRAVAARAGTSRKEEFVGQYL